MPHVFTIKGPPQSGKTMMALGIAERARETAIPFLCLVPTAEQAQQRIKREPWLAGCCFGYAQYARRLPRNNEVVPRLVVMDDYNHVPLVDAADAYKMLKRRMDRVFGVTQIIIVRSDL